MGTATRLKSAGTPHRTDGATAPHSPEKGDDHTQQRVGLVPDYPALSGLFPLRWRGGARIKKEFLDWFWCFQSII